MMKCVGNEGIHRRKKAFNGLTAISIAVLLFLCAAASAREPEDNVNSADGQTFDDAGPSEEGNSGLDIVLALDHSYSIRSKPKALQARDDAVRLFAAMCGGVDSSMGVVYFAGGFLPEASAAYLPEGELERENERWIIEKYPEFASAETDSGSALYNLNDASKRAELLETEIGRSGDYLSDNISTNIAVGLNWALEMLEDGTEDNEKVIVLFSDGKNDTNPENPEVESVYNAETKRVVEEAQKRGVKIYSVYLGEFNPEQSDLVQLRKIVNYYEGSTAEETDAYTGIVTYDDRLKEAGKSEELEERFIEVFTSVTSAEYEKLEKNPEGVYDLASIAGTDGRSVFVLFRGLGASIAEVERTGEILSSGDYYSYETRDKKLCGLYLNSADSLSEYRIYTNSREETGYLVYARQIEPYVPEQTEPETKTEIQTETESELESGTQTETTEHVIPALPEQPEAPGSDMADVKIIYWLWAAVALALAAVCFLEIKEFKKKRETRPNTSPKYSDVSDYEQKVENICKEISDQANDLAQYADGSEKDVLEHVMNGILFCRSKYERQKKENPNAEADLELLKKIEELNNKRVEYKKELEIEYAACTSDVIVTSEDIYAAIPWADETLTRRRRPVKLESCRAFSSRDTKIRTLEKYIERLPYFRVSICGAKNGVCVKSKAECCSIFSCGKSMEADKDIFGKWKWVLEPGVYELQFPYNEKKWTLFVNHN